MQVLGIALGTDDSARPMTPRLSFRRKEKRCGTLAARDTFVRRSMRTNCIYVIEFSGNFYVRGVDVYLPIQ